MNKITSDQSIKILNRSLPIIQIKNRNNKKYKWNRIYLLASSLLAMVLPFFNHIHFLKKSVIGPLNLTIIVENIHFYSANIQTKELEFGKIILSIFLE